MNETDKILQEIGSALWSIFREDADEANYYCQSFLDSGGRQTSVQFCSKGMLVRDSDLSTTPTEVWRHMTDLCKQLQTTPPFKDKPFTHMRLTLTEDRKMNVEFAYIPEWDSWPGIFMRGVSELSREEAENPAISNTWGVDLDEWKERRARREREPYTK